MDPKDGGSTILSYNVQWDQGSNVWTDLVGSTIPYLDLSYDVKSTEHDL